MTDKSFYQDESFFPLLIKIVKTQEKMVCKTEKDLPNNTAFVVLETNYHEKV